MPIRTFQTPDGVTWQVWNVVPGRRDVPERRIGYDRRSPDPVIRYGGPDRRSGDDRRHEVPFVSPRLASGWLAFECAEEKRRLAPIPQHWERMSASELERLCARAVPVLPPQAPQPSSS